MILKTTYLIFFLLSVEFFAQTKKDILSNTILSHYPKNEIEKINAAKFLIANINIHKSINYKWLDSLNHEVPFSELNYEDIDKALDAFTVLKDSVKIHPKTYTTRDEDIITPELLIKNIDLAFDVWKNNPWSKSYDFKTFCEYILPYRSLVEPLEDWREEYQFLSTRHITNVADIENPVEVATQVILGLKDYRFLGNRPDPIPILSPKQLLFRRSGACPDLANLALLACRSIGLATTFDFTPQYGASSNRHFWNTIIDKNGKHIPFNGNAYGNNGGLPLAYSPTNKRLAKVFRKTFSTQKNSLAYLKNKLEIPDKLFLQESNIIDVTKEYLPVSNISYNFASNKNNSDVAYLNVFNIGRWRVVDWAKKSDQKCSFKDLGTNLVYLPSTYINHKMINEPYPILLNSKKETILLKPNYKNTFNFLFDKKQAEFNPYKEHNSLEIQNGKIYLLLVWDHKWKKVAVSKAKEGKLLFKNVPENGLFLIASKNSNGYERTFIINDNREKIIWY
ncbi:transglutaminase-like domain-containing protein [Wenyingzhuangia aestuarii]|uniref:transglutaminase-like domain-containing protein n=1 Tax=Wenyingzhuangia aestuarii TaxID=1647582 RepID=UPI00143ACD9A|nr:transglutaminase-like domain-containing protein [Wenyingzhuangia aestuarii]NJB82055.1 hypothetical protein [Wenyingzhuangia aestuarii]